jgi:O-antigen ligase
VGRRAPVNSRGRLAIGAAGPHTLRFPAYALQRPVLMVTLSPALSVGLGAALAAVFLFACVRDIRLGLLLYLLFGWLPLDMVPLQGSRVSAGLWPAEVLATILFGVWFLRDRPQGRPLLTLPFERALAAIVPLAIVSAVAGLSFPDPAVDQRHLKPLVSAGQLLLFGWPLAVYLVAADVVKTSAHAARLFTWVYALAPLSYLVMLLPAPYDAAFGWAQYFGLFTAPYALVLLLSRATLGRRLFSLAVWLCPLVIGIFAGRAFFYGVWLVSTAVVLTARIGSRVLLIGPLAASVLVLYLWTQEPGALPGPLRALVESEEQQKSLGGRSGRGAIWADAIAIWSDHPIFGVGPGNSWPYMNRYSVIDTPHSQYFNVLLELGVVGLAAFLAFLGSALAYCVRLWKRSPLGPSADLRLAWLGVFVGLVVGNALGDFMLHSIRNDGLKLFSLYYPQWVLLGAIVGSARHETAWTPSAPPLA